MRVKVFLFVFFLSFIYLLCAETGNCGDNSYNYKAVIKTPVAGVHERANSASPLVTQALLNEEIEVITETGSFVYARVPDGYTGYIRLSDITTDLSSILALGDKVIIRKRLAAVYDLSGREIYKAPLSSMFFGHREGNRFIITLPQNVTGYVYEEDAYFFTGSRDIPFGNGRSFAESAMLLLGTNYLWGGCSAYGIDCSGLTYIAAKINGLQIPRDSGPQSKIGTHIDLRNVIIGDQLFFGPDAGKSRVTHTGIYLGDGNFIHSSNNGVVISNIFSGVHMSRFMFAKRLF